MTPWNRVLEKLGVEHSPGPKGGGQTTLSGLCEHLGKSRQYITAQRRRGGIIRPEDQRAIIEFAASRGVVIWPEDFIP